MRHPSGLCSVFEEVEQSVPDVQLALEMLYPLYHVLDTNG